MTNHNTIENVVPIVNDILHYIGLYTGYNLKYGYFDMAKLDEHKLFTIYDHNGGYITSWDLNDAADRADLMTRSFIWYDVVPKAELIKYEV